MLGAQRSSGVIGHYVLSIITEINSIEPTASTPKVVTKNDLQVLHCVNLLINRFVHSMSQKINRNVDMLTARQKTGIYR